MLISGSFAEQNINSPQKKGANIVNPKNLNLKNTKQITARVNFSKTGTALRTSPENSTESTFKEIAFDEELGIYRLTKKSTRQHLNRDLFGNPEYTATYYDAVYDKNATDIQSTYIQFVSDSEWDRVLYGSLTGHLKSLDNIKNPGEIAVNSAGMVFIAERGAARIRVLKVKPATDDVRLEMLYTIDNLGDVNSIAYNDGGTPFELNDDYLFAADFTANLIYRIKISAGSAFKEHTFSGFRGPQSISFGRYNGVHNNDFYLIDYYSKNITRYYLNGDNMVKIEVLKGQDSQIFSTLETDYFGQVYIADVVNNELSKYSSGLEFLDGHKLADKGICDINIPFGTVTFKGSEKYWLGFDQLFAVQNWSEESGLQRFKLETALKNFYVYPGEDEQISMQFFVTDYINSTLLVYDDQNKLIYKSQKETSPSGLNTVNWNRKKSSGEQIPAGRYSVELELESVYDNKITTSKLNAWLPLFYHITADHEDPTNTIQKIRGNYTTYNEQTVIEDMNSIEYKISGLNSSSEYEMSVQLFNPLNVTSDYEIVIDGSIVRNIARISPGILKTDFFKIPLSGINDNEIFIMIRNPNNGTIGISDLWLKETGTSFKVENIQQEIPSDFALEQNYPNPFNPQTTIRYHLPQDSDVRVTVFDLLGREIATLVNGYMTAGVHNINFNASSLASGIYLYRIEAGSYSKVKRMLLIK
jgi:hypothetical protein